MVRISIYSINISNGLHYKYQYKKTPDKGQNLSPTLQRFAQRFAELKYVEKHLQTDGLKD